MIAKPGKSKGISKDSGAAMRVSTKKNSAHSTSGS
jgi:hypothetical protein